MIYQFDATGTKWFIEFFQPLPYLQFTQVKGLIDQHINQNDLIYSRFNPNSQLYQLNQAKSLTNPHPDLVKELQLAEKIRLLTHDSFTPFIGSYLEAIGYDPEYSFETKALVATDNANLGSFLELTAQRIEISANAKVDLGAFAKGVIVDSLANLLKANGHEYFLINAGGDIYATSDNGNPIKVGIENPLQPDKIVDNNQIINQAICSSSNHKRKWNGKHAGLPHAHIKTDPEVNIDGVTVISNRACVADLVATCIMISGEKYLDPLSQMFEFTYTLHDNLP